MADRFFARRGPFSLEFLADAVDGDLDAETDRRALIRDAAALDSSTAVGAGCRIDADAVIGAGVELGERCEVGARAVIGAGRVVGADCRIGAGVTIGHALIGAWVRIWPDARIRQPSFDFVPGASGLERGPQLGRVIIGDDLESGANATIDRGTTGDTEIGSGCIIDNLVQIAHNVSLGQGCIVGAQAGISGSTRLEDHVVVGGQAGLSDRLKVGKGARVAARGGVMRDIEPGGEVGGSPTVPIRQWHRQTVALRRLARKKGD